MWNNLLANVHSCDVHDDVIKCEHFPRYWPFVRGIHRSPVNSPHKGQWRGASMSSLIGAWLNSWVNNRDIDDLKHHRAHYDVTVMFPVFRFLNEGVNVTAQHAEEIGTVNYSKKHGSRAGEASKTTGSGYRSVLAAGCSLLTALYIWT